MSVKSETDYKIVAGTGSSIPGFDAILVLPGIFALTVVVQKAKKDKNKYR